MNSNELKGDKLYILDMPSLTVYDILSDKARKGDEKDRAIYDALHGWWDCNAKVPKTKICHIDKGFKYSLAKGDLIRSELNTSKTGEAKITFMQRKPLRKTYFYETGLKWPYLINKSTQKYYGWDISKGVQIWSIRKKMTVIAEFDAVPDKGMEFFTHQDRAIIIAGFEGEVLDINISSGLFRYIPKYKNKGSYNNIQLNQDNNILLLWCANQMPSLSEYKFTFDTKSRRLSPKHPKGAFKPNISSASADGNRYVIEKNSYFELYRKSDNIKLATFSLFEKGEWSVTTPQGYFNASSYNVLVNILKKKREKTTLSNMQAYAKKWYRPDIVEAILSEKEFTTLKNRPSHSILPLKALNNNMFKESLKQMITLDKRLDLLRLLKENKNKDDIPFLQHGIETATDKKTYEAYYKTLTYYYFHKRTFKTFIESRIKTLNAYPLEQAPLLRYIYSKHGPRTKKAYILQIVNDTTLTNEAKMVISRRCKANSFSTLEPLLWEVWEKQFFVSKKAKSYLEKKDTRRAKTALKKAEHYHEKETLQTIPKLYEKIKSEQKFTKEHGIAQRELVGAYKKLNEMNSTAELSQVREIAMANLDAFFKKTDLNPYSPEPYLHFIMKYGNDITKKILHTKIEIYILSFYDKNKKHNTYALNTLLKAYFSYQPGFVLETMITLSKSSIREVRSGMAYHMRNFKDPKFVQPLLNLLDFKDEMVSNYALSTILSYDTPVIKKVIKKLNAITTCSKIHALDTINSRIAKKVDKETYAKYRCGN